ncbi:MAG: amidohydrolase family protein [Planctomycetota bacterium]|nr:amidohydrolase family protein [Planctomycetota bacterium]
MTIPRTLVQGALCASLLLGSLQVADAAAGDKLVIEAGRIITQAGDDIVDGVIVIENGRITAIGAAADVEKPWDAPVLGGPDFVASPGFVEAHSDSGMDRSNENLDVTPFLNVRDSIDPVSFYFEDCKRWGITTINVQQGNNTVVAGNGRIVKPTGMTVEEMTMRPNYGFKISIAPKGGKSRATQRQALERAFGDLRSELEELATDAQETKDYERREALAQGRDLEEGKAPGRAMTGTGWKVEGLENVDRAEIDEKILPLLEMVEGRHDVFLYCGAPMDVQPAIDFAAKNGLTARTTLVLDNSCWKAADAIAASGLSVVLDSNLVHVETDVVTEEETETFVPGVFAEKGIPFALSSANSSTNSLWFQAAVCVGHGMSPKDAMAAVTTTAAEIIGLGDQVGSLEVGKLANVLLLTGDPLDMTSFVEQAVVEGSVIYDRTKDVRNKHLYEGVEPRGAAAVETEEAELPSKDDAK